MTVPGKKPADPDDVVEAYGVMQSALFAHPDYGGRARRAGLRGARTRASTSSRCARGWAWDSAPSTWVSSWGYGW